MDACRAFCFSSFKLFGLFYIKQGRGERLNCRGLGYNQYNAKNAFSLLRKDKGSLNNPKLLPKILFRCVRNSKVKFPGWIKSQWKKSTKSQVIVNFHVKNFINLGLRFLITWNFFELIFHTASWIGYVSLGVRLVHLIFNFHSPSYTQLKHRAINLDGIWGSIYKTHNDVSIIFQPTSYHVSFSINLFVLSRALRRIFF